MLARYGWIATFIGATIAAGIAIVLMLGLVRFAAEVTAYLS